jgi:hypothetical protein
MKIGTKKVVTTALKKLPDPPEGTSWDWALTFKFRSAINPFEPGKMECLEEETHLATTKEELEKWLEILKTRKGFVEGVVSPIGENVKYD